MAGPEVVIDCFLQYQQERYYCYGLPWRSLGAGKQRTAALRRSGKFHAGRAFSPANGISRSAIKAAWCSEAAIRVRVYPVVYTCLVECLQSAKKYSTATPDYALRFNASPATDVRGNGVMAWIGPTAV